MENKNLFKIVFILSSGKSIVYTMKYENAIQTFDLWKQVKTGKNPEKIFEVNRTNDGSINERFGIDLTLVDAIQINSTVYEPLEN